MGENDEPGSIEGLIEFEEKFPMTDHGRRERASVLGPLAGADFASASTSSPTVVLPFCVIQPASSMRQISGGLSQKE